MHYCPREIDDNDRRPDNIADLQYRRLAVHTVKNVDEILSKFILNKNEKKNLIKSLLRFWIEKKILKT